MNAKANVEAVPTANDRLRAAFAERDKFGAVSTDLMQKIERLAPIEAEVAMARAELEQIMQADAEAMHAWINKNAKGSPPDVNARAREEAARKIAAAQTRLGAAVGVKTMLEKELTENNERLRAHQDTINAAIVDVIGEEAMRAVRRMVEASAEYLEREASFQLIMGKLNALRGGWGNATPQAVNVGHWCDRIVSANKITQDQRIEMTRRVIAETEQVIEQLLSGEDPVR